MGGFSLTCHSYQILTIPTIPPGSTWNMWGSVKYSDEATSEIHRRNYFTPSHFYCVETICAPCGIVIAWAKFAKSISPTNILNFLETIYPTEESRPAYICIDKACLVLQTAISNGSWDAVWKNTTRFIVDTYHYINHHLTDYLCWK